MASLVTCSRIGQALASWIENAPPEQLAILDEALAQFDQSLQSGQVVIVNGEPVLRLVVSEPAGTESRTIEVPLPSPTLDTLTYQRAVAGSVARPARAKMSESSYSIADFDRSVSDQAAVQAAIDNAPRLTDTLVPAGQTYNLTTRPTNTKGARLVGPGKVMIADGYNGAEQYNTYRNTRPISFGREYFSVLYKVMDKTNRPIRCYAYGDSTVEGGFNFIDWPFFLQQLLPDMAARKFRTKLNLTNRGVGGSNLSTWNPAPDIGVNSSEPADLVILKCGINDGTQGTLENRLDLFRTRLRAGLEAIRNTEGGGAGQTAILLVGPNATIDKNFHRRTAEWMEQLRDIFEAAARDYHCAYFDAYAYMQDTGAVDDGMWAIGQWLQNDTAPGELQTSLHPLNMGYALLWGAIFDFIFNSTDLIRWSGNSIIQKSAYFGHAYADPTWTPNNYDTGITFEVARASDGYPFDGILLTQKSTEGQMKQELFDQNSTSRIAMRTANPVSGVFGPWRGLTVDLTLANGWTPFGAIWGTPKVTSDLNSRVTIDAIIAPGTRDAGTNLFTLPVGYRPGQQRLIIAHTSTAAPVQLEVLASGNVQLTSALDPGAAYLTLTGLSFLV